MDFTISRVPVEERTKVEEFVKVNFLPDMPLIVAFGLQNSPPPRPPPSQQPGPEDFTLRAVDALGETVGVAVNKVNPNFFLHPDAPEQVKKV